MPSERESGRFRRIAPNPATRARRIAEAAGRDVGVFGFPLDHYDGERCPRCGALLFVEDCDCDAIRCRLGLEE